MNFSNTLLVTLTLASSICLTACHQSDTKTAAAVAGPAVDSKVLEANKQLTRDYFQAFLKGDTAWMKAHIAPTFIRHDPGLDFEVKGPEGVAKLHDVLMPAFPNMVLPLEDFVAEGDKVLVRLRVQGDQTGKFGDMAPSGKHVDIGVMDLFQIKDGVLVEHWALLDNFGMLKQLGAIK